MFGWSRIAAASGFGRCLNEPGARYTAPRNHACSPRIGSTRLWKKLCLLPPVYSYTAAIRSLWIVTWTPRSAAASTAVPIWLPASSSRHRNARISTDLVARPIRSTIAGNARSPLPITRGCGPSCSGGGSVDSSTAPAPAGRPRARRARRPSARGHGRNVRRRMGLRRNLICDNGQQATGNRQSRNTAAMSVKRPVKAVLGRVQRSAGWQLPVACRLLPQIRLVERLAALRERVGDVVRTEPDSDRDRGEDGLLRDAGPTVGRRDHAQIA